MILLFKLKGLLLFVKLLGVKMELVMATCLLGLLTYYCFATVYD